ncbi:MBL fold metallo-hydrolase [Amycolatopsis acidicola]|nr:MBL fold metallo-hydrolase [Amycolatopsis acidicola]
MTISPTPRVAELAPGIFAYVQPDGSVMVNNAGFVASGPDLLLIDTCATEARTKALLGAAQAKTGLHPTLVVNTHHHGDHTFGNCVTNPAPIISHEYARRRILSTGLEPMSLTPTVQFGDLVLAAPTITIETRARLYVGAIEVHLLHLGVAHTAGDLVVWLPKSRVLYAGDILFNGGTPFLIDGSLATYDRVLDEIRDLDPRVIVPGHGDPAGTELLDETRDYLRWLRRVVAEAHERGQSPLEAARAADPGPFSAWLDSERLVVNIARGLAELKGAAPAEPLDYAQLFADMTTLRGGPIHTLA